MNEIKHTIMLVDDSSANLKILSSLLKGDYNLIVAKGGQKALDIISRGKYPDLFLLDIQMPDLNGYAVCQRLQTLEETKDIPIIFLSSLNQIDDEEKGLKLGAVDYITKPFVPSIVSSRIKTHLELSDSIKKTKKMYAHSLELNRNLSLRNAQIDMILNNSGEGFLVLEKDFKVHSEHSKECDKIFGYDIYGKDYKTLFSGFHGINIEEDSAILQEIMTLPCEIIEKKLKIYLSLMPEEIEKDNRCYKIRYAIIKADNLQERKIMLVLKDITEEKKLERKVVEEHRLLLTIISVISDIEEYKTLIINAFMFFGNVVLKKMKKPQQRDLNFLYRATHTFKGEFGKLNIMDMVERLDKLEYMLSDFIENGNNVNYDEFKLHYDELGLLTCMENINLLIEKHSGRNVLLEDDKNDVLTVNKRMIQNFEIYLESAPDKIDKVVIQENLRRLEYRSLYSVLDSYCNYAKTLSVDLGKEEIKTTIRGDDVFLDPVKYGNLLKSFIHIFRNMVDHGIETADERFSVGKDIQGSIICDIKCSNNEVNLAFTDDGKGVELSLLKQRIQTNFNFSVEELNAMSEEELLQYLFEMNISTKASKSSISGRGVGLSAVKSELMKINGKIEVESKWGQGTKFHISFTI